MPYIPRTLATSNFISSDNVPKAPVKSKAAKLPVPYNGPDTSAHSNTGTKENGFIGRINMSKWDVDPVKILKNLTGKELAIDEHSRLVPYSG